MPDDDRSNTSALRKPRHRPVVDPLPVTLAVIAVLVCLNVWLWAGR